MEEDLDSEKIYRWLPVAIAYYVVSSLAFVLTYVPGWYHELVQRNAMTEAIQTVVRGPHTVVLDGFYSGANFHGVFGAPFVMVGADIRLVRLPMLLFGLVCLWFVYRIGTHHHDDNRSPALALILLAVTPHFVIFSGSGLPQIVTLTAGVGSLLAYLYYLDTDDRRWAIASGAAVGIAAFNHFWGGVAFGTVVWYDLLTLIVAYRTLGGGTLKRELRQRCPVWASHLVGLVPAIALYLYYRLNGRTTLYTKFNVFHSYELLFDPGWYTRIGFYAFEYQPAMLLGGLLMVSIALRVLSSRNWAALVVDRNGTPVVAPPAFWSLWLLAGIAIPVLFPLGSSIHEYYIWWAVIPGAGLAGWWYENDLGRIGSPPWGTAISGDRVRRVVVIGLIVTSALLVGIQGTRGYVGPSEDVPLMESGVPPVCIVNTCPDPPSNAHAKAIGNVLGSHTTPKDIVVGYGDLPSNLDLFVLVYEFRYREFGTYPAPEVEYIVSTRQLSAERQAEWRHFETVQTGERSAYLYERR